MFEANVRVWDNSYACDQINLSMHNEDMDIWLLVERCSAWGYDPKHENFFLSIKELRYSPNNSILIIHSTHTTLCLSAFISSLLLKIIVAILNHFYNEVLIHSFSLIFMILPYKLDLENFTVTTFNKNFLVFDLDSCQDYLGLIIFSLIIALIPIAQC